MDIPIEKKFKILVEITRASHFAWRKAVEEMCPGIDTSEVVYKMWEITGHETAKAYLKHLDPSKPLPVQIARSIVWSSQTMGEDAKLIKGEDENEAFVEHDGCPWFTWHDKLKLLDEDQPGCDKWFETTINDINRKYKAILRVYIHLRYRHSRLRTNKALLVHIYTWAINVRYNNEYE